MAQSISQLKKQISDLEKENRELEEKKKLQLKLARLKMAKKESAKPRKPSVHARAKGAKKKIRSFLGPVGDSFDRAFG